MSILYLLLRFNRILFLVGLVFIISGSCSKNTDDLPHNSVDFYAISEYKTMDQSMAIIESTVRLSDSLFIPYAEIFSYNPADYTFTVSNRVSDHLSDFDRIPLARKPFAVVCDGEIIYSGYFWYSFMSSMCDWTIIDPIDYSGENKITVSLGYPADFSGVVDRRNDPRLLEVLRRHGKLRD
jgi:hypothetical protein